MMRIMKRKESMGQYTRFAGCYANRIGFLGKLHGTMNRIADLSKLAT